MHPQRGGKSTEIPAYQNIRIWHLSFGIFVQAMFRQLCEIPTIVGIISGYSSSLLGWLPKCATSLHYDTLVIVGFWHRSEISSSTTEINPNGIFNSQT